ncbi:Ribosomal RNA large subunit methyltransferase N [Thermodesulfobium narugense DSM 14796]|uniref:Probable dual-specificity RNA methyltransferase RlmN n=1 Tax=Thermodesulfobium narugense DSM 14796 TaxID=747365 RepID=M1E643_9BACT|nr:23S rRNA (adenine(2503)-C(2))-methyltransferase RlmN [Thermodesulfobium narugense]AEE14631.1 Ribosomal RNA large subunit methyltransferase N [Thermodesulfobium narugense DSM 14796]
MNKRSFFELSFSELEKFFTDLGFSKYRANQVFSWVYKNNIYDFMQMSNLSLNLRDLLSSSFDLSFPKIQSTVESADNSFKFLLHLGENDFIETVFINHKNRNTICISSQIGCPVGCVMCSTGKIGFKRNLKVSEIVLQVMAVENFVRSKMGKIDNIVFMGMGEPMLNFDNVIKAIKILTDKNGKSFSPRRIVISTSGFVDGIKKLKEVGLPIKLAVSLHATTDEIRSKLIPINKTFGISELIKASEEYALASKRRVTYEYVLMESINDSDQDIIRLKDLLKGLHAHVNLVKYNQSLSNVRIKTNIRRIKLFEKMLNNFGIKTTIRFSKGEDINGACGQLALLSGLNSGACSSI